MAEPVAAAPMWKRVVAPILDFIMVFFVGGYLIGCRDRQPQSRAASISTGWPALLLFALVVAYFYVGRRVAGGTLWDRFFGIGRPQPR